LDFFTAAHIFTVVRDIKAICLHYDIDIWIHNGYTNTNDLWDISLTHIY
jgi:hypothetical protein